MKKTLNPLPRLRVDDAKANALVTEVLRKRLHRQSRPFRALAKQWSKRGNGGNVYGIHLVGTPTDTDFTFPELFDSKGRVRFDLAPPSIQVVRKPVLDGKRSTGGFRRTFDFWRPRLRGAAREAWGLTPKDRPLHRCHQAIHRNGVIETGLLSMAGSNYARNSSGGQPVPLNSSQVVDAFALLVAWIDTARKQLPRHPAGGAFLTYLIEVEIVAINHRRGTPATVRLEPNNAALWPLPSRSVRFPRYLFPVWGGISPASAGDIAGLTELGLLEQFECDLYHYCEHLVPTLSLFEVKVQPQTDDAEKAQLKAQPVAV